MAEQDINDVALSVEVEEEVIVPEKPHHYLMRWRCICQSLDTSLKAIHNSLVSPYSPTKDVYANL